MDISQKAVRLVAVPVEEHSGEVTPAEGLAIDEEPTDADIAPQDEIPVLATLRVDLQEQRVKVAEALGVVARIGLREEGVAKHLVLRCRDVEDVKELVAVLARKAVIPVITSLEVRVAKEALAAVKEVRIKLLGSRAYPAGGLGHVKRVFSVQGVAEIVVPRVK